jgi:hypothetical protein
MKCRDVVPFTECVIKGKLKRTDKFPEELVGEKVIVVGRCAIQDYIFIKKDLKAMESYMIHRKDVKKND